MSYDINRSVELAKSTNNGGNKTTEGNKKIKTKQPYITVDISKVKILKHNNEQQKYTQKSITFTLPANRKETPVVKNYSQNTTRSLLENKIEQIEPTYEHINQSSKRRVATSSSKPTDNRNISLETVDDEEIEKTEDMDEDEDLRVSAQTINEQPKVSNKKLF